MKKTRQALALLLALVMVLALAACGKDGGKAETTPTPEFVYAASYTPVQKDTDNSFYAQFYDNTGFYGFISELVGQRELKEGETLDWDGQLDVYEQRLYHLGFDGKMERLDGYSELKQDVPEDHEFYTGTRSFTALPGGGFITVDSAYESWSDPVEDGVDAWGKDLYHYEENYYIRKLDANAAELSCVKMDLEELMNQYGYFYPRGCVVGEDGMLLTAGDGGVYAFDPDTGVIAYVIESDNWMNNLFTLRDGRVAVTYWGDSGQELAILDVEKRVIGESFPLANSFDEARTGSGDYDFYYTSGVNFYGYKLEEGESTKLFNWLNCDVDSDQLSGYTIREDGSVVGIMNEWDDNYEKATTSFVTLSLVPYDSLPQKETITLATQNLQWNWELRRRVLQFNRKHDDVRIEVLDYSEYNTDEDYEAGLTKLRTEMLSGNMPDILDLSQMPARQLAAKGFLTDLYELMDADPELNREDFFPNVLATMESDGKLYSTISTFTLITAVGAKRVVGDTPGWNYQQLMDALATMPEGSVVFGQGETRTEILQICLMLDINNFVNWETGEVSFDSQEFIDLLEFAKSFPADFDWESAEPTKQSDLTMVMEGRQLLTFADLYDFSSLMNYQNAFGGLDEFTFIGFPTAKGVGNLIQVNNSGYAITRECKNKAAAWEFVRQFFTEEYQESEGWGFPSNIHSYEKMKKQAMEPEYIKDENGKIMVDPETGERLMYPKGGYWDEEKDEYVQIYSISQDQIDLIDQIVRSADRVFSEDTAIYDIVREQVEAYFSGQKSAQDVAKLIQSKANIYVNEQR